MFSFSVEVLNPQNICKIYDRRRGRPTTGKHTARGETLGKTKNKANAEKNTPKIHNRSQNEARENGLFSDVPNSYKNAYYPNFPRLYKKGNFCSFCSPYKKDFRIFRRLYKKRTFTACRRAAKIAAFSGCAVGIFADFTDLYKKR